mgnify:CR=1 FL=1
MSKFSIYLALLFLGLISIAFFLNHILKNLLFAYLGLSIVTFLAYWIEKSKAQRGAWRTQENTLHMFIISSIVVNPFLFNFCVDLNQSPRDCHFTFSCSKLASSCWLYFNTQGFKVE